MSVEIRNGLFCGIFIFALSFVVGPDVWWKHIIVGTLAALIVIGINRFVLPVLKAWKNGI
jgi:hypothetical protein